MANPLYGQNKTDADMDLYGRGKQNIIITTAAHTLSADDSGATVLHNVAAASLTLPPCAAGLNFKVILGIESTAGCNILTSAATESFFGTIPLNSDVVDVGFGVPQQITYATSIAAPDSYDAMKFVAATATIGGVAGEVIHLTCVSSVAWHVDIPNHATSADDAATLVLLQGR